MRSRGAERIGECERGGGVDVISYRAFLSASLDHMPRQPELSIVTVADKKSLWA